MKSPKNLYKAFFFNFFKFLLPIGTFFTFSFWSFKSYINDLESDYLLKTGEKLVDFLNHDEDIFDNQYLGYDYIILITDSKGKILSSNRRLDSLRDANYLISLKPMPGQAQDIGNYLAYVDKFLCGTSLCKVVVALSKAKIEKRVNLLLLSSVFSSVITALLIAFLSVLDIRKHLHDYELYSKELRKVALYLSHEVKTPLSIILMNLSHIKADEDVRQAIERAIRRIIKLMKNLKVLSELELKPTRITLINIKGLISELVEFYQANLYAKNLTISVDHVPNVQVLSDYELIYTLFLNLLDNAVKYAKEGTQIKISGEVRNSKLRVLMSNITDEKNRLDMEDESYGLGLTIVDEVAKRLGIQVSFKRDASLFTVVLDLQVGKEE
ncbi:sensor histidine kinase [Hydrogenobacter hydrogenophilus]|uniref:histidine kinase n=1 Tax=Hydrogenobacter hydrogenophilus TaxID=35835 RepID=A0A285P6N6_9AQUI|nr:HAMP domain-containing sensor histidine kinase [Hydrogenobacter hydrogenophilus]SNZ15796.1 His Kinase A (phospho-acceptor) domain-containing protein [Hydrogenobacter hydrogenophilus]